MNFFRFFSVVAAGALATTSAWAQTTSINTTPQGVITFPLTHGTTTYFSLPFENPPAYSGTVTAVTANTIQDTSASWTASQFVQPTSSVPYFIKFLTTAGGGQETGRIIMITANNANTLTLDTTDHTSQTTPLIGNTPSFDVQVGDAYEIFAGQTLATLFGAGTTQDPLNYVTGAGGVGTADTIAVSTTSAAPTVTYFFNTTAVQWQQYPSAANANNTIVYPYSTLAVTRRSSHPDSSFSIMGSVSGVPLLIKTLGKATTYNSTEYAYNIALGSLNLGSNWVTNASVSKADTLSLWNGSVNPGHFDTYYELPDLTWRKYPNQATDVSSTVIPAGTAITITKRGTVSGQASFLTPPLPYNLGN